MPCATTLWNMSLLANASSRCVGLTSPDMAAKSSMSLWVSVRTRLAVSPSLISSNVLFSMRSIPTLSIRSLARRCDCRHRHKRSQIKKRYAGNNQRGTRCLSASPAETSCSHLPAPVADFRHVFAMLADIELVPFHGRPVTRHRVFHLGVKPWNAPDRVQRELIAIEIV